MNVTTSMDDAARAILRANDAIGGQLRAYLLQRMVGQAGETVLNFLHPNFK